MVTCICVFGWIILLLVCGMFDLKFAFALTLMGCLLIDCLLAC